MVNLAILSFEHVHAPHYAATLKRIPEAKLIAVSDEDPSRLEEHAELISGTARYSDYRELLAKEPVDGVIICSRNAAHKEMTIESARAGKHVLCEKPIATRLEDAREMIAVCKEQGVILQICFPARYAPSLHKAKKMIADGEIGQVVAAKTSNHGTMPGGWFVDKELAGGGAIIDHTVHIVDAMRWLFDAEFTEVYAEMATRLYDIPTEDVGLLSLEMSNGLFATLDTSWSRPAHSSPLWGDAIIELIGARGNLKLDLFPWTLNFYSEAAGKHVVISNDKDLNRRLLQDFVDSIQSGRQPLVLGEDGLRALEVVLGAYSSISTKQPVQLK